MLFPVSGVEVHPLIPFGVAFAVSFFTSMGGVTGAFLLLPFQVSFLGYAAPSVSATNQVFNIVATPGGAYRYLRERRMFWPLFRSMSIGTLPGVFIGAWIRIRYLLDPEHFKCFAGIVLLYVGWRLLVDLIRTKTSNARPDSGGLHSGIRIVSSSVRELTYEFGDRRGSFSPLSVQAVCFVVGIVGGIYGIGGGALLAPILVSVFGLPVYIVAGATLLGSFVASIAGVMFYQLFSFCFADVSAAPDWLLGGILGAGGFMGMYLGARVQKFVPERIIKTILCVGVLFLAGSYLSGFFR